MKTKFISKQKLISATKILIAAVASVFLAQLLKLDFAISAGIVAILSVQPTKKETVKTGLARFYAFLLALIISFVCFKFLGFTTQAFFLYLLFFILICQAFEWYAAMAMDSVLISHFLNFGRMGFTEIKNEVLLFVIGVGMGILANIFLHKNVKYIEELKNRADQQIKGILHRMSLRIMDLQMENYDGHCFEELDKAIFQARSAAQENYNNQFRKDDIFDQAYISMRRHQKEVLVEIFKCIIELKTVPATAKMVSDYLEKVSVEYEKGNDVESLLSELKNIQMKMKEVPLPVARDEFEDRALLFMILRRLEEFLNLKKAFYQEHQARADNKFLNKKRHRHL